MKIIEIKSLSNGAHNNQTTDRVLPVPPGWAVVPDNVTTENFPFGEVEVKEVNGVMTVTKWTPGEIPEPEPVEPEPTEADDTAAMLVDHEYRLTLLELGLTE